MSSYRLLVVEDEEVLRDILVESLTVLAPNLKAVTNGAEALEILKKESFDAIISDINMPVMTGLELLAEIRKLGIETPFVFLSAFGDKDNIQKALQLGANNFIDKPFSTQMLLDIMSNALQLGVAMRELDDFYNAIGTDDASVSQEEIQKMKAVRKTILMMRSNSYVTMKKLG